MAKSTRNAKKANDQATINRRANDDRRETQERRKAPQNVGTERRQSQRRKVARRRQIDPTTCERDYSNDEIEFMQALDAYKRASGRMFPTCSEVLEVIRNLGYEKVREAATTATRSTEAAEPKDETAEAALSTEDA